MNLSSPSTASADTVLPVTIIINNYNYGRFLRGAIESALAQSYAVTQVIVVDDGSTDDTSEVVARLVAGNSHIRYDRRPRNGGHLAALLHGLQSCTTNWIALLDADDELLPDSLERRFEAARAYHDRTGIWPQLVYGCRGYRSRRKWRQG